MSIPPTWEITQFGDVVEIESDLVDPATAPDAPHIAPNHIESWTGQLLPYTTVSIDGVTSPKHRFRPGQILYSKIRPYLAKAVLVDFSGLCSADMYPLTTELDVRFLHRWILTDSFTSRVAQDQGRTVLPKVNQAALVKVPVPVPPLNEQKRIVAKIEELTARSRRAKEALDAVPPLLDKLRQSILAAAFRGDLTADWRAKNPNVEPADLGVNPVDPYPKRKRAARSRTDVASDEEQSLPNGWRPARLWEISEVQLGQRRAPEYGEEKHYAYVRAANITWRGLDLSDVKSMGFADPISLLLQPGDVMLTEASGSPKEVGKPAIWRGELLDCCFQATVLRLRANRDLVLPEWLYFSSLADATLGRFAAMAPGVGILHLTSGRMREWPIPLPPLTEQRRICELLEEALNIVYEREDQLNLAITSLSLLDQSILAKAFRGELVPQDPTDEPASVLLDRIRTARETSAPPTKPKRAPKPTPEPAQLPLELAPILPDDAFAALWPHGPLDKATAVRKLADHLRQLGRLEFQHLRADGPLYAQLLATIEAAVKAGYLDRPHRGQVRAFKLDPTTYTADDWCHVLVASLGPDPIHQEDAVRQAAEWARDNLGLEFARLRSDGHIATGLRTAITSAIRQGLIARDGKRIILGRRA